MSLSAKYQAFLGSPSSAALSDNASLHYITTLTSLNEPAAILKHLAVQDKLLKKKAEKVIGAVESANGLCLDVETTIEFISGGGAFLPGLDDNFVADRIVTFPMVHIVHFDKNKDIAQIRLYWDQGSLLKQIDVIGARARNWPIRDGRDQSRLIASSSALVAQPESAASSRRSTTSRGGADEVVVTERPASSRSTVSNAMNDPHATLSLFQPRDTNQDRTYARPSAARAQSAKPPPRDYSELFAGEEPESPSPVGTAPSPQKAARIPVKSGGGTNFKPNRLFGETEEEKAMPTPMSVKTNSKKYDHFNFGDDEDEQATPKVRETARQKHKSKHMSQWDFEDFVTPEKTNLKILAQAVRHFGWSDDEADTSPVRRPIVHKARPDADPHFEFVDDGAPTEPRKENTSKGRLHNNGLGLYKDHVLHSTSDDEGEDAHKGDNKRPLGDVTTTIKNENRKKDFGSQWEMTDHSPGPQKTTFNGNGNGNVKHVPEDRKKVLQGLNAHWGLYEDSPEQSKKENVNTSTVGVKTTGNGMGGRKDDGRHWAIGDEGDDYVAIPPKAPGNRPQESKGFWDF
ncbi:uncharacterized protein BDR25DRAFT_316855 [Lindgomyces ingoldianus]|uniref:Uncharacterized protein n=1 Tax=Lindgomyces ingoldianus TaxID=673940 RepID=A0ACB6QKY0_9PLEO|nr:uncharacterized protein BDR25DRAFT_316855 [Lindgomyces ingoldianus]KAF2467522.1 hypothetical protein BDR25DRAFT_316855 [Lindgomyces ingoldianus]